MEKSNSSIDACVGPEWPKVLSRGPSAEFNFTFLEFNAQSDHLTEMTPSSCIFHVCM